MKTELKPYQLGRRLGSGVMVQYNGVLNGKELSAYDKKYKHLDIFEIAPEDRPEEVIGLKLGYIKKIEDWKNGAKYKIGVKSGGLKTCYGTNDFKPIYRPKEHLTIPITHNGETFVPIEWFEIGDDSNESIEYDFGNIKLIKDLESISEHGSLHDINYLPYGVIQKLIEWHFVLDEPEGTWISVDELDTNPYEN